MDISPQVIKKNPYHTPLVETNYFQWLRQENLQNIHSIETKKQYLNERFNFIQGVHTLDKRTLTVLKYVEEFYFRFYVKGKYDKAA